MFENRSRTVSAGVAGLLFVVLVAVSAFIAGFGPDPDAPATEIREFLADNRTPLLWGGLLGLLAFPPIVWFVVVLAAAMRRATGNWLLPGAMVLGLVFTGAMALTAPAVVNSLIWAEDFVDAAPDDLVVYAWNAAWLLYAASSVGFVIFLAAFGVAVMRTAMMPVPVGWLAGVGAVLALIAMFSALGATVGVLAFLGFLSFLVVVTVASIVMLTGAGAEAEVPSGDRGATGV